MQKDKLKLASAMGIFGSIGIVRRFIPYPSGFIAFVRGALGALTLLLWLLIQKEPIDWHGIKRNVGKLFVSGSFLGLNWVFLFEAYRFTSISAATMAYYMAPVFVLLMAPILLGERLSKVQALCAGCAVLGMTIVSGIWETGLSGAKGVGFGLLAACFYAALILLNRLIQGVEAPERTLVQLAIAAFVLLPYVVLQEDLYGLSVTPFIIMMLLIAGIVHTGFAYALYFGSIGNLPAPTVALFSYLDPILAVFLSALILGEALTLMMAVGITLVLGSTFLADRLGQS